MSKGRPAKLKATILIDPERPKAKKEDVLRMLRTAGIGFSQTRPDFGVVVGGDGIFSHYGRLISIPLLFVSVRSRETTASKGYLADVNLDDLPRALRAVVQKDFRELQYRRLQVSINGAVEGDVFTDVYLEKGADSNCLRYHLDAKGKGAGFSESAISNGVIICTSAGSTGYYSYVDKLKNGRSLEPERFTQIEEDEIGVCHIAPVLTKREGTQDSPLRYTLPWMDTLRVTLTRDADARLFGLTKSRKGLRIRVGDYIDVRPSNDKTRVLKLGRSS
jgi:NAD+ kinase